MPRGPLPDPNAIRRNKPTIPTTNLPAGGRKGDAPEPPAWASIAKRSKARTWWNWAWSLPEAAMWSDGDMQPLVRLAKLSTDPESFVDTKIMAVMAQLEDRLGLSVKAKAALRVKIVAEVDDSVASDEVQARRERMSKLRAG